MKDVRVPEQLQRAMAAEAEAAREARAKVILLIMVMVMMVVRTMVRIMTWPAGGSGLISHLDF